MRIELKAYEKISGSPLKIVIQMKSSTIFSDARITQEYVEMVLRNAKMMKNVELTINDNRNEKLVLLFARMLVESGL